MCIKEVYKLYTYTSVSQHRRFHAEDELLWNAQSPYPCGGRLVSDTRLFTMVDLQQSQIIKPKTYRFAAEARFRPLFPPPESAVCIVSFPLLPFNDFMHIGHTGFIPIDDDIQTLQKRLSSRLGTHCP